MSPEEKDLLNKTFELSKENNAILLKMRRAIMWGTVTKVIYYGLIILSFFGAYYLIQPYLESVIGSVGGDSAKLTGQKFDFEKVLNDFNSINE